MFRLTRRICNSHSIQPLLSRNSWFARRQTLKAILDQKEAELFRLEKAKQAIDIAALRKVDRVAWVVLVYLLGQGGLLFYWVYFKFDWNLVEPITYLLGYSASWLGLVCYLTCGHDFCFDAWRARLLRMYECRLYRKHSFNSSKYNALHNELQALRKIYCSFLRL